MTNENKVGLIVATVLGSVAHTATYTFRNWKKGTAGYDRLQAALVAGKLTPEDIAVTKDKEGKVENDLYQRKPVVLALTVPLLDETALPGFTPAQVSHTQSLINQAVEKAQSALVDEGNVPTDKIITWQDALEQPFKTRAAAVKITDDMLKAATTVFKAFLVEVGSAPKAVELITELSMKKYALTACTKVPPKALERIQGRLVELIEALDAETAHTHAAVLEMWAANIEKAINPVVDEELDLDMI